ncbi:MAG: hypothetical protein J6K73_13610 [Clostridia bacterium]|nr:hypothetical protein [Clostridia bacterium]MBP3650805.1 hypothetical protein [Clostridia bacterium]
MTKKCVLMMLALALLVVPVAGLAEASSVQLPYGVTFGMNLEEAAAVIGEDAQVEEWYEDGIEKDGTGSIFVENVPLGIGNIQAGFMSFDVSRNNSPREPRLDSINLSVVYEGNCIAAFRSTLADLTAVYGQPDSDPFDEYARESYQEFGNLSASWTLPDTRIYLSLNQAYTDNGSIDLSYAYRLCYDLSDLDE